MDIILSPFVWLLEWFNSWFNSYGLALILFAVVVKVVLFPLSLKGKRSMIQMNMLSGQMQKLQKQYGNNRERYNLEVQKLYEKEKVNPMGGCLWSFIPLIILMVLYPIIREPIHYMMGINDANTLNAIAQTVNWSSVAVDNGWLKTAADPRGGGHLCQHRLQPAVPVLPDHAGQPVRRAVRRHRRRRGRAEHLLHQL